VRCMPSAERLIGAGGRAAIMLIVFRFGRPKCNNWLRPGWVDVCNVFCGPGLRRQGWCRGSSRIECFAAPCLSDGRPGRSDVAVSRCCDVS